jgi:hypothetical protein
MTKREMWKMKYKEEEPSAGTRGFIKQRKNSASDCDLSDASPEIKSDSQTLILRGFRFGNRVGIHCPWFLIRAARPEGREFVSRRQINSEIIEHFNREALVPLNYGVLATPNHNGEEERA